MFPLYRSLDKSDYMDDMLVSYEKATQWLFYGRERNTSAGRYSDKLFTYKGKQDL